MRILLIQPPKVESIIGSFDLSLPEPLALEILAANLPEYDIHLLDMRMDKDLEKELTSFNPHIVGVTAFTVEVYKAIEVLRKVKEYDEKVLTIIGG
ncbi:MAG: cobalamin-dependent protein, partial [Candidatus Firestonebacteria bacterium]